MKSHVVLFDSLRICPVCGNDLKLKLKDTKVCPQNHIRFRLFRTAQRRQVSVFTSPVKLRVRIQKTGEIFDTQRQVADHIGGQVSAVNECLRGKRKTHRGHTFEWVE